MSNDTTTEIRNVVIGTAGHIDHGKSTLVRTLTGIDPTRLDEEKARGMTIDLGFSNFLYKDRFRIGIIDVPGHEKFVKNMVAGATGIDIVLLVIAADDGVMPQTREHLDILTLLGVGHGVIALNKADKVDADMLELAREDVADLVRGTFLEHAPVVAVSALQGAGIEELWQALSSAIDETEPKDSAGVFRMPVQRVFSAQGHGAVLTGIPLSGAVSLGDAVEVLPVGEKGKVRGIQAYHRSIEQARAGHSTALNIAGVDHTRAFRGCTVATPGVFSPVPVLSARLRMLKDAPRGLKNRVEIKLHVGTSEMMATLHLLGETRFLEPGAEALCQFLLEEPLVAGMGDRFIVRLPSPAETLGGGRIIRGAEEKLAPRDNDALALLARWEEACDDPRLRVELAVLEAGPAGTQAERLVATIELPLPVVRGHAETLLADGILREFGPQRALIHHDAWSIARRQMNALLARFHQQHPAQIGQKAASLQQQLGTDARTFQAVLQEALQAGEIEQRGELLALPGQGGKLSDDERRIVDRIAVQLEAAVLNPPTLKELALAAGTDQKATQNAVDYLCGAGRAQVLHGGVLFSAKALDFARDAVVAFLTEKGEAAAKDFKEVLPTSRKFLIPLLEWMDQQGVTRNVQGTRTLK